MIDEGSLRFILSFMIPHKSFIGYAKSGLLGGFWIHLLFVNNLYNKCLLILKLSTVQYLHLILKLNLFLFFFYYIRIFCIVQEGLEVFKIVRCSADGCCICDIIIWNPLLLLLNLRIYVQAYLLMNIHLYLLFEFFLRSGDKRI